MYTKVVDDLRVKWLGDCWEPYRQEVPKHKRFALLRVPQDLAVSYRPGTRFVPMPYWLRSMASATIALINGYRLPEWGSTTMVLFTS